MLQDGAAAQYGTDAIAGVVNIILKKNDSGGMFAGSGGAYMDGGGQTYDLSGNIGFPLGSKGFINFTGEKRFRGFSFRGFGDTRVVNPDGTPKTVAVQRRRRSPAIPTSTRSTATRNPSSPPSSTIPSMT